MRKIFLTLSKMFCDENAFGTEIALITEIETCVYEIHVNNRLLCNIPRFGKDINKFLVECHPVVDSPTYEAYQLKREQNRLLKLNEQAVSTSSSPLESNEDFNLGDIFSNQNFDMEMSGNENAEIPQGPTEDDSLEKSLQDSNQIVNELTSKLSKFLADKTDQDQELAELSELIIRDLNILDGLNNLYNLKIIFSIVNNKFI